MTKISMQIVPGYYLRLNSDGCIEQSTCVNNTASEHFMVERLFLMIFYAGQFTIRYLSYRYSFFSLVSHVKLNDIDRYCLFFSVSDLLVV